MNGHKRPALPVTEFTGEAVAIIALHRAIATTPILPVPIPSLAVGSHFI